MDPHGRHIESSVRLAGEVPDGETLTKTLRLCADPKTRDNLRPCCCPFVATRLGIEGIMVSKNYSPFRPYFVENSQDRKCM